MGRVGDGRIRTESVSVRVGMGQVGSGRVRIGSVSRPDQAGPGRTEII